MKHIKYITWILAISLLLATTAVFLHEERAVEASENDTLGELPPGSIVSDRSREWSYKAGNNYTNPEIKKEPIEWIVIAQDHFAPGTTLLMSREMLCKHLFHEDSMNTDWETSRLRNVFLNGVVYGNFSSNFQNAIVPVSTITSGNTLDNEKVFLLSVSEMMGIGIDILEENDGEGISYFDGVDGFARASKRRPHHQAPGVKDHVNGYWTRSEETLMESHHVWVVMNNGSIIYEPSDSNDYGVRPVVNLESSTKVSPAEEGYVFDFGWFFLPPVLPTILPHLSLFSYTEDDGEATITGYIGTETDIEIPGTIAGYPVVAIGHEALMGKGLASVLIPDSVTEIDLRAFMDNEITTVNLGDGLQHIRGQAFENNLISGIAFPEGLETIGYMAFSRNGLSTVDITGSVTSIGFRAFHSNNINLAFIPENVIEIGDEAFAENQAAPPNLVIRGIEGTKAQIYAIDNDHTFVAVDSTDPPGESEESDVNGTGEPDLTDGSPETGDDTDPSDIISEGETAFESETGEESGPSGAIIKMFSGAAGIPLLVFAIFFLFGIITSVIMLIVFKGAEKSGPPSDGV